MKVLLKLKRIIVLTIKTQIKILNDNYNFYNFIIL